MIRWKCLPPVPGEIHLDMLHWLDDRLLQLHTGEGNEIAVPGEHRNERLESALVWPDFLHFASGSLVTAQERSIANRA